MARRLISENPAAAELSDDSMRWLCQALDPFPDYEQAPASWPDFSSSASVVQVIKGTHTITVPGGSGPWDCHVFNLPQLTYNGAGVSGLNYQFTASGNALSTATTVTNPTMSWLNVHVVSAGNPTLPTGTPSELTYLGSNTYADIGSYLNGPLRVVAAGFEVRNTTAAINKQGTCTVYAMPQTCAIENLSIAKDGGTRFYNNLVRTYKMPPPRVSDALTLFGSRQWEASEGVYVPITFAQDQNPFIGGEYMYTAFKSTDADGTNYGYGYLPNSASQSTFNPQRFAPMNTHGAFFSGLSEESTLVVTWKVYLERAPGYRLTELTPLAFRQGSFDPDAFKLYAAIVNKLPPACKAGDNDAGDWFKGVMNKIADLAPTLAPAIGMAFGIPPSVSSAAGNFLASGIRGINMAQTKKKKPPPKVPPGAKPAKNTFIPKGETAALKDSKVLRPARKSKGGAWKMMAQKKK